MKALFLHLSDFHFRHGTDALLSRVSRITAALGSVDAIADLCVVAATGDIAFSGKKSEYEIADRFFETLKAELSERYGEQNVELLFVPGNHDCDFSTDSELRNLVIQNLPSKIGDLRQDDSIFRTLIYPQSEFFQFSSKWMKSCEKDPWVFWSRTDSLNNVRVRALCYNTAFSSQLDEEQGKLFFPLHLVSPDKNLSHPDAITIGLLHHPYSWIESNNGIALRDHIETVVDFVLTGHQHSESIYSKKNIGGEEINYFEGAALRGDTDGDSGFNVVLCDLAESKFRRFEFRWNGDVYSPTHSHDWSPFIRNRRVKERFEANPEYRSILHDPGTGFTHPRKPKLQLEDIFIYPDLTKFSFERRVEGRDTPELISSSNVKEFLLEQKKVFVTGQDRAGKTSLTKILYSELMKLGFVPVAISATGLISISESKLIGLINEAFVAQYSQSSLELYKQLGPNRKVVIVDDWHKTKLTFDGRTVVVDTLSKLFGRIYIFSAEGFRIEEISRYRESANPLRAFELCEFREFGHVLRARLVEKWYCIGRNFTWDVNEHAREIDDIERLLATLLGKNLIPSYPETILSILQTIEAHNAPSTPSGSYGYLYEALLTSALANVCKDSAELDLMYTFISRLAFYLFSTERKLLSRADVEHISGKYFDEYSIPLNVSDLLARLETAQVILKLSGNYSFRYKYVYYYFVGRYFQEALRDTSKTADTKKRLHEMADQIYYEEYSGILMFVLYLTKDADFIRHIMRNADSIYSEQEPCDFERDVDFVNRLYKEPSKVLIPSTDLEKNREEHRKKLDEAREQDKCLQLENEKLAYSKELNDIIKINIAFKTLQLLGQTLKNFPGSLQKDIKIEMARSCYFLGLRLARAILKIAENNLEVFRNYFAEIIREHRSSLTEGELAKTTDEAVIWLTRRAMFAILKRVSYAVGLEILQETYRAVLEDSSGQVSVRLIDLSVKLDHFSAFPEKEIEKLWEDLRKNNFSRTLIRDMVGHYIYLFGLEYRTLQKMGATLDIKVSDPRFHNPNVKKLKG
jgi:Calcineurin-like phosphoesterase